MPANGVLNLAAAAGELIALYLDLVDGVALSSGGIGSTGTKSAEYIVGFSRTAEAARIANAESWLLSGDF